MLGNQATKFSKLCEKFKVTEQENLLKEQMKKASMYVFYFSNDYVLGTANPRNKKIRLTI